MNRMIFVLLGICLLYGLSTWACDPLRAPQEQASEPRVAASAELVPDTTTPEPTEPDANESLPEPSPELRPPPERLPEAPQPPDFAPLPKEDPAAMSRNRSRPYLAPTPHSLGTKDLESLLEPVRQRFRLPSLVAAIYKQGKIMAIGAVGARKAFTKDHVQLHDKYHLGSCTKAMTATLAALLVEQGKIKWDTTLEASFPTWKDQIHVSLRTVTLRQLLSNRGGLTTNMTTSHPAIWQAMWATKKPPREARLEFAKALLKDKPAFPPNTRFAYSNTGFVLAGVMLEQATETTWESLLQTQLFQPLKMDSCGFGAPGTPGKTEHPWGHQVSGLTYTPIEPGPKSDNAPFMGPAGTVHCNLFDWGKFLALHLAGAQGKKGLLLTPESFQGLHKPRSVGTPYAQGWIALERDWAGGLALFHNGTNGLFFASVWIAPKADKIFFAATNQGGTNAINATDNVYTTMLKAGY